MHFGSNNSKKYLSLWCQLRVLNYKLEGVASKSNPIKYKENLKATIQTYLKKTEICPHMNLHETDILVFLLSLYTCFIWCYKTNNKKILKKKRKKKKHSKKKKQLNIT